MSICETKTEPDKTVTTKEGVVWVSDVKRKSDIPRQKCDSVQETLLKYVLEGLGVSKGECFPKKELQVWDSEPNESVPLGIGERENRRWSHLEKWQRPHLKSMRMAFLKEDNLLVICKEIILGPYLITLAKTKSGWAHGSQIILYYKLHPQSI